jgi:hypothetical protein
VAYDLKPDRFKASPYIKFPIRRNLLSNAPHLCHRQCGVVQCTMQSSEIFTSTKSHRLQ